MHRGHLGVVEILDDRVSRPGNWNQHAQARQDEQDATEERDASLGPPIVASAGGALHAATGHGAGEPAHEDGQTHEGAGGLDVWRQGQHGVVRLTLHVTRGLVDAVHPDAFPPDLCRQDEAVNESRDLPLRQGRDGDGHDPASHRTGEADQLHPGVHHGDDAVLRPVSATAVVLIDPPLVCYFVALVLLVSTWSNVSRALLRCHLPPATFFSLFLSNICSVLSLLPVSSSPVYPEVIAGFLSTHPLLQRIRGSHTCFSFS